MNDNTMAKPSLRELFEAEFGWAKMPLLPYGTPLTLEDFECWSPSPEAPMGWTIQALDERGRLVEYRISPLPDNPHKATATVDGKPAKCRQIGTKEELPVDLVTKWCDWILLTDAHARIAARRDVKSPDWLEHEMHRLDRGVSADAVYEDNIGTFASVKGLERWANWALSDTVVRVEMFQVWPRYGAKKPVGDGASDALRVSRRRWGSMLCGDEWKPDGSELLEPSSFVFDPELRVWDWRNGMGGAGMKLGLNLDHSGSELLGYRMSGAISWEGLHTNCRLVRSKGQRSDWWGLHVLDTDLAMVFPSHDVNFVIGTQDDGSFCYISPWMTGSRAIVNVARDKMEREWGRWLDMTVELSEAELAEGIKKAEAMARGRHKP